MLSGSKISLKSNQTSLPRKVCRKSGDGLYVCVCVCSARRVSVPTDCQIQEEQLCDKEVFWMSHPALCCRDILRVKTWIYITGWWRISCISDFSWLKGRYLFLSFMHSCIVYDSSRKNRRAVLRIGLSGNFPRFWVIHWWIEWCTVLIITIVASYTHLSMAVLRLLLKNLKYEWYF